MSASLAAVSARRYRTRHSADDGTSLPQENPIWRSVKVPASRQERAVQLELLGPEELTPGDLPGLPDPTRLMLERVDRAIQDTLGAMRPQLNRLVREIQMHLQAQQIYHPQPQLVDESLEKMERHLRKFVDEAVAFKTWTTREGDE